MSKLIIEFESMFGRLGASLVTKTFRRFLTSPVEEEMMHIIHSNPVMNEFGAKLFFSTEFRQSGMDAMNQAYYLNKGRYGNLDIDKFNQKYNENLLFEDMFMDNMRALDRSIMANEFAMKMNLTNIEALMTVERFQGLRLQGYPKLEYDGGRISRTAFYDQTGEYFQLCATNPGEPAPVAIDPGALLVHESTHAVDNLINKIKTEQRIRSALSDLSVEEMSEILQSTAEFISIDFAESYNIKGITRRGFFDPSNGVASEYSSFAVETLYDVARSSRSSEELRAKYAERISSRYVQLDKEVLLDNLKRVGASRIMMEVMKENCLRFDSVMGVDVSSIVMTPLKEQHDKGQQELKENIRDQNVKDAEEGLEKLKDLIENKIKDTSDLLQKAIEANVPGEKLSDLQEKVEEMVQQRGYVENYVKTVPDIAKQPYNKATLNELTSKVSVFSKNFGNLSQSIDLDAKSIDFDQIVVDKNKLLDINNKIKNMQEVSENWVKTDEDTQKEFEKTDRYDQFLDE